MRSSGFIKIATPLGMDAAVEGLTRAILREQPNDIYVFAAKHFEKLVRVRNVGAHTAGLSPSSTQDSNSKTPAVEDDVKPIIAEEKSLTEEPESNDTSYGVEATAVRTLAASTGTVAILGTTAKTNGKNEDDEDDKQVKTILEENESSEENKVISLEKAQIHEPNIREQNNDNIENSQTENLEISKAKDGDVPLTTQLPLNENIPVIESEPLNNKDVSVEKEISNEVNTEKSRENSVLSRASDISQNVSCVSKAETTGESPISVVEVEGKNNERTDTTSGINQEPVKDVEEDNSKSISSERLKTNSISDTTLSESFNAELENNSVKQSPSVEKVLESFDNSSTVEFVDVVNKEGIRSKRSIDEDLIDGSISSTSLRSSSVDVVNQSKENLSTPTDVKTELLSPVDNPKNMIDVCNSNPDEVSSKNTKSTTPTTVEHSQDKSTVSSPLQLKSEQAEEENNLDKIQEDDLVSKVDSSLIIEDPRPVSAVIVSPIQSLLKEDNVQIDISVKDSVVDDDKSESRPEDVSTAVPKEGTLVQNEVNQVDSNKIDNENNTNESDDKLVSAATTIQATFRGYQTRQNLKTEENILVNELPSNQEVNDQLNSAATTIQATFRGFQERKNLKTDDLDKDLQKEKSDNITDDTEVITNQEEINKDLNSAATTIQATFRGFQARQNIKSDEPEKVSHINKIPTNVEEVSDELNSAATTIQATFRGFQARQNLKTGEEEKDKVISELPVTQEEENNVELPVNEEDKGKLELPVSQAEVSDELIDAATTIQATFRGFKARQNIKNQDIETDNLIEDSVKQQHKSVKQQGEDLDKLNSAATTIQATFRGFQARQSAEKDNIEASEIKVDSLQNKETIQDILIEDQKESTQIDGLTTDENNDQLVSAATTIQASFRGFQTRQGLKNSKSENNEVIEETVVENNEQNEELNSAATTIQANFRGFQARKTLKNENLDVKPEVESLKEGDDQLSSAATTIQAAFRGFQTRQDLKRDQIVDDLDVEESLATLDEVIKAESADLINFNNYSEDQEEIKTEENLVDIQDELNDKLNNAASTIQASFRDFQSRQNLKNSSPNKNEENFNNNQETFDRKTPVSLTPEILDSVKDEVNEICKQAIATTESILAGGKDNVSKDDEKINESHQNSIEESAISDVNSISNSLQNDISTSLTNTIEDIKETSDSVNNKMNVLTEETKDDLLEDPEDRLASAATTIQASFRGFQARQSLQKMVDTEEQPDSMPDYPPPALDDESLFGPPVADEDLPLPDFEALESSYSEDVPTEPLAPPPIDHDSLKFNEEDEFDEELQSLQKPQECDELPEHRLTLESDGSTEVESSLSSAATKIQAGVRGFLTRRQFQTVQKGTDSTSAPSIVDSDRSVGDFSGSHEEEGPVRSAISIEEESEICRHRNTPEKEDMFENNMLDLKKRQGKRMSLGNSLHEVIPRQRKQRALSMQIHRDNSSDEEVWSTLKNEMSNAATLIQSNYRGYRARKQFQREDAVQVLTSSSSQATTGAGSIDIKEVETQDVPTRSSGEYHDIIALTPPNIQKDKPPEES